MSNLLILWVQDPSQVNEGVFLKDVFSVLLRLSRSFNDIVNDKTAPESELINDAIVELQINPDTLPNEPHYHYYNCSRCGSGLNINRCPGCGYKFSSFYRVGWHTPLPLKVVAALREAGHEFVVDPEEARKREREVWEAATGHRE